MTDQGEHGADDRVPDTELVCGKISKPKLNVTYIDSAGLGILVAAHVSAKNQGAARHLSNLGNKFHDVLQLTRLLTVFSVYDTEADAISSSGTSLLAAPV